MATGIIADLAIGAHPGGADAWAGQEYFATGFTVGAPPDAFNQRGQDWGLPPMHPRALAAAGYRPLADLIGANLSLGGGLRIDHVMGLSRLWWIPEGRRRPRARTCTTTRRARSARWPRGRGGRQRPAGPSSSARTSARWSRGCVTRWPPAACSAR